MRPMHNDASSSAHAPKHPTFTLTLLLLASLTACGNAPSDTNARPNAFILAHSVPDDACAYPTEIDTRARWSGRLDTDVNEDFEAHVIVENASDTLITLDSAIVTRAIHSVETGDLTQDFAEEIFGFSASRETPSFAPIQLKPGERANIPLTIWSAQDTQRLAETLRLWDALDLSTQIVLSGSNTRGERVTTNTFALPITIGSGLLLRHTVDKTDLGDPFAELWRMCADYVDAAFTVDPNDAGVASTSPPRVFGPASMCAPGQDLELDTCMCASPFVERDPDTGAVYSDFDEARELCFRGLYN